METSAIVKNLLSDVLPVNPLMVSFSQQLLDFWESEINALRSDPDVLNDQRMTPQIFHATSRMLRMLLPSDLVGQNVPKIAQLLMVKLIDASKTNTPATTTKQPQQ